MTMKIYMVHPLVIDSMCAKCYLLSVCILPLHYGTSFHRYAGKYSLGLGVCIDGRRTSDRHIGLQVATQRTGGYGEISSQRQVTSLGEGLHCRPGVQDDHEIGHL